ncbi:hypothetical protein LTR28_001712 [Elasticomyces elasticus]|nr:hypothetical protein LTR28_001712 [Elasticomyces elasticus]
MPYLRASVKLGDRNNDSDVAIYDVKFYPYASPDAKPVFACTGGRDILQHFRDDDDKAALNSLVWSQDPDTGDPLLCVSGEIAKIRIIDVKSGSITRTLVGHGAGINDLVVSPRSPSVLASASEDHSIRLWNLDATYQKRPCAALLVGEGHKQAVLSISFHHTGKYLISGGQDLAVNLWVVPDVPDENADTDNTTSIHFPHFASSEIHADYVDWCDAILPQSGENADQRRSVMFYNDLIISRSAKENKILLWKIDGFNSADPPPAEPPTANAASAKTRSAFGGRFQRLYEFDAPHSTLYYMRFGLYHAADQHPVLAMGNEKSAVYFWDLQKIEEGYEVAAEANGARVKGKKKKKKIGAGTAGMLGEAMGLGKGREESCGSNASSAMVSSHSSNSLPVAERRSVLADPFYAIPPHLTITEPKVQLNFPVRQIDWSPRGDWCVSVGDYGMICLFRRWE